MQDDTGRPNDEVGNQGTQDPDADEDGKNEEGRDPFFSHLSDVQDFFNEFVSGFRGLPYPGGRYPRYDLLQTDAEYRVLVDVPGVPRERLELNAVGDELTIGGDRPRPNLPEGAEVMRSERGFGRFRRTVRLPTDVDAGGIRAKLDAGVLQITLPRRGGAGKQTIDIEE